MSFSWTRVGAIIHKELRDYRHNRFVIGTMAATAMLFIIAPTIQLLVALSTGNTAHLNTRIGLSPFLIAKAVAAFVPTLVIAYIVFGIFLAAAALFAHPVIASAIYAGTRVLVSCCSRRCVPAGRSGVGSRSPPGPRMCGLHSS